MNSSVEVCNTWKLFGADRAPNTALQCGSRGVRFAAADPNRFSIYDYLGGTLQAAECQF